jgi:hypothetical protein
MSRRHILADLHDYKLDPKKAHTLHKTHLKHETKAAEVLPAAISVSGALVEIPVETGIVLAETMLDIVPVEIIATEIVENEQQPETLQVEEVPSAIAQLEKKSKKMKKKELEVEVE